MEVMERTEPLGLREWVAMSASCVRTARAMQLDAVHAAITAAVWATEGHRSKRAWLAAVTGDSPGQCSITLLLAERIQQMPLARQAFVDGDLSESALRLLADTWHTDVAEVFARDEALLVRWATRLPHRDAKTVLQAWVARADPDRVERTSQETFDRRRFHLNDLLDGMGRGDFLLDAEGTAVLREAITFLGRPVDGDIRSREQRHADALVSMAKFVLTNHGAGAGTKRRVPKVVATIDATALATGDGAGTIETGHTKPTVVTADAIRRLACDAGIHRYITDAPDAKVHYGRQTRTISDALFDVLMVRDHGCRWTGCAIPSALCEGHHAIHWDDLGDTEPDNLVLLCWYHHHLLHEQHWSITPLGAGHFKLTDPHGTAVRMRPPLVGLDLPGTELN